MVDCGEIRGEILDLKAATGALEQRVEAMRETGEGLIATEFLAGEAGELSDAALTKYLDEFVKRNPEAFETGFKLGEKIRHVDTKALAAVRISEEESLVSLEYDGVYTYNHRTGSMRQRPEMENFTGVEQFCRLSDREIVICDGNDAISYIDLANGGGYDSDFEGYAECLERISDTEVLVGGADNRGVGALKIFDTTTGEEIWEMANILGDLNEPVEYLKRVSDHEAVVGTGAQNFVFDFKERAVAGYFAFPGSSQFTIATAAKSVGEGKVLVGAKGDGMLKMLDLETYEMEEIEGASKFLLGVTAMERFSEHEILVADRSGRMYVYDAEEKRLKGNSVAKIDGEIGFIERIAENKFLVGGSGSSGEDSGELRVLTVETATPDLEGLKKALRKIAAKA